WPTRHLTRLDGCSRSPYSASPLSACSYCCSGAAAQCCCCLSTRSATGRRSASGSPVSVE
ncbi:hypothetical protein SOVF_195880, partial [Spinacia oleracea]